MMCPFVALAFVSPRIASLQAEHILTQNGSTLQRVLLNPDLVQASRWQYRMYVPQTPAIGVPFWGIVEESTFPAAQATLARLRSQQVTWWSWLGKVGRPEPMNFTAFNTLGPIAIMDDSAWNASWVNLGPGATREIAARRRRLDAIKSADDALYRIFDEKTWEGMFEEDLFHNAGLNIYQAPWLANAMTRIRTLEMRMRSANPISVVAVNNDLSSLISIATHLDEQAAVLDNRQPAAGSLSPSMSTPDAVELLNKKFMDYAVSAGEGGSASAAGSMSFKFTENGFQLVQAPTGWYGGIEAVSFNSIDPLTVRYDPQFGGPQRGGIVYLPKEALRASFRGPAGLLLPLATSPRDAEFLAQAFRRLARLNNGIQVTTVTPEKAAAEPDAPTMDLANRLKEIATRLRNLGSLTLRDAELDARTPAPLAAAIARRDNLWRDSELSKVLAEQITPQTSFSSGGQRLSLAQMTERIAVPMSFQPINPPLWRAVRINVRGNYAQVVVRQVSEAQNMKTGERFTLSRLIDETWSNPEGTPRLQSMRLISAHKAGAPRATTYTALAHRFFKMGDQYLAKNQLSEAERSYRRAITMQPDWSTAWNSLGVSVVRQGRINDAAPLLQQSVYLNPKYGLALTNLADVRRGQGQNGESVTLAKRATELAPNDPWAHIVYGHADFASGDFVGAETQYRTALRLDPNSGATHADLAGALLRQNKKTEATAEASRAIELGWRNHWVYSELAIPK